MDVFGEMIVGGWLKSKGAWESHRVGRNPGFGECFAATAVGGAVVGAAAVPGKCTAVSVAVVVVVALAWCEMSEGNSCRYIFEVKGQFQRSAASGRARDGGGVRCSGRKGRRRGSRGAREKQERDRRE